MADELVLAGWTLVRPVSTPRALGRSLPRQVISISDCIQDDLPLPQWWDWTQDRALLEEARRADAPDARIVAIALEEEEASRFMAAHGRDEPCFDLLRQGCPIDGTALGFEVVGTELDVDFHSWLCYHLADDALATLGIEVNGVGLLDSADRARQVREWMLGLPMQEAPPEIPWTYVGLLL